MWTGPGQGDNDCLCAVSVVVRAILAGTNALGGGRSKAQRAYPPKILTYIASAYLLKMFAQRWLHRIS